MMKNWRTNKRYNYYLILTWLWAVIDEHISKREIDLKDEKNSKIKKRIENFWFVEALD